MLVRRILERPNTLTMKLTLQVILFCLSSVPLTSGFFFDTKCYDELGCFPGGYPWSWPLRPFPSPQSPKEINTTFYITNRRNRERVNLQTWPVIKTDSLYGSHKPSFVITHGFYSDSNVPWMMELSDAILSKVDGNVLWVDWSNGASTNYMQAASNTRIVGAEITRFIKYLIQNQFAKAQDFHLLGHSLGSHIMSYVGKNITGIKRLTALDPAQPGFQGRNAAIRIDNKDAEFVDVIHTDGRPFLPFFGFGMSTSVGDVDFYVNGGILQPNCIFDGKHYMIKSIDDIKEITLDVLYNLVSCSHTRAPRYMAAAINACKMLGHRYNATFSDFRYTDFVIYKECSRSSCSLMGLDTIDYPARGNFALETTGEYPFCKK